MLKRDFRKDRLIGLKKIPHLGIYKAPSFNRVYLTNRRIVLYCVYTMFPAAPAAPFAGNVACCGVLVIDFSDFQDLLRLRCNTISVTSHGSDKPVCHGGAKVRYGYPRSITVINTFYYGLLRSVAF